MSFAQRRSSAVETPLPHRNRRSLAFPHPFCATTIVRSISSTLFQVKTRTDRTCSASPSRKRVDNPIIKSRQPQEPAAYPYFVTFAQVDAFKHSTVPSIIFPRPSLNLPSSTMFRFVTCSVSDNAAPTNDKAACFLSAPLRPPNKPSIPLTIEGTKDIP